MAMPRATKRELLDLPPPMTTKSPICYPGGKTHGADAIIKQFPRQRRGKSGLSEMVSPFIGGGTIELMMAARGVRVYAYDAEPLVANFWEMSLHNSREVAAQVRPLYPMSRPRFLEIRKILEPDNQHERRRPRHAAACYFALTRTAYGACALNGGYSKERADDRLTLQSIDNLYALNAPNLSVARADFRDALNWNPDVFAYCDPPYPIDHPNLYGWRGEYHAAFPHEELAGILRERENWVCSNKDCELVRDLYTGHEMLSLHWNRAMGSGGALNEVIIFSRAMTYKAILQPAVIGKPLELPHIEHLPQIGVPGLPS